MVLPATEPVGSVGIFCVLSCVSLERCFVSLGEVEVGSIFNLYCQPLEPALVNRGNTSGSLFIAFLDHSSLLRRIPPEVLCFDQSKRTSMVNAYHTVVSLFKKLMRWMADC